MQKSLELVLKQKDFSTKEGIEKLKSLEWKDGLYEKQSWGHSMHKIGPYVGRIKPSFAHFLIKYLSKSGETVLDPFCGIGTIAFEGALMGRKTIGSDINPYALKIAKAKSQHPLNINSQIKIVDKIKIDRSKISLKKIPSWVLDYYNKNTLKEILFLLDYFQRNNHSFLYGCLLAISQGHRPGHLSKPCAWTLPYKPRDDDPGEYREVKPRLKAKIERSLKDFLPNKININIKKADARNIKLCSESVDTVISSPPYFNTLDYISSHRLRLAVMGVYEENKKKRLQQKTIQHYKTYLVEMEKVIKQLHRVLKTNGICTFVVGDHFLPNRVINTSEELLKIFKLNGFKFVDNIKDSIPINKSVQKKTNKIKSERILIVQKK